MSKAHAATARALQGGFLAAAIAMTFAGPAGAAGLGGVAREDPFAAEHIGQLPPEVKSAVLARARACGARPAAAHYFSVSITTPTQSFLSLHFEELYCPNRATLCSSGGCLHEIYVASGGSYRRAFSVYADDVTLTKSGSVAGLEVQRGGTTQFYRWSGRGFVAGRP